MLTTSIDLNPERILELGSDALKGRYLPLEFHPSAILINGAVCPDSFVKHV